MHYFIVCGLSIWECNFLRGWPLHLKTRNYWNLYVTRALSLRIWVETLSVLLLPVLNYRTALCMNYICFSVYFHVLSTIWGLFIIPKLTNPWPAAHKTAPGRIWIRLRYGVWVYVGLKRKGFFSFSGKVKISRFSQNFVSRKFSFSRKVFVCVKSFGFRESFHENFRFRESVRKNFSQF
jgi:hypothetical protein